MTNAARTLLLLAIAALAPACLSKPSPPGGGGDDGDDAETIVANQVAAGGSHACTIVDGDLYCWGNNDHGQLGNVVGVALGSATGTPSQVDAGSGTWTAIAASTNHTCGIRDGAIYCWGDDSAGEIGDGGGSNTLPETLVTLPAGAAAPMGIYAGDGASCAIDAAKSLYCWGTVDGTIATPPTALQPTGVIDGWIEVAIALDHVCARNASGLYVACWGSNSLDQLGIAGGSGQMRTSLNAAIKAGPGVGQVSADGFVSISARSQETCGIRNGAGSAIVCWGENETGLFGSDAGSSDSGSIDVEFDSGAVAPWRFVALGNNHACATTQAHEVFCWGDDAYGALGDGFAGHNVLNTVPVLKSATAVAAGDSITCAIGSGGAVSCWGANVHGELGDGSIATQLSPVLIAGTKGATAIAVGMDHTCALIGSGTSAKCWGFNEQHQVDNGSASFEPTPTAITAVTSTIDQIVVGASHTCARAGTAVTCWGVGSYGQVGDGSSASAAMSISGAYTTIAAGDYTSCALTAAGDLDCWGITPGKSGGEPMPTKVTVPTWGQLAVSASFAMGIVGSDGPTVQELGSDAAYTGLPTTGSGSAIVTAMAIAHPQSVLAAADDHACVLFTETTALPELYCWGSNDAHQVGSGSAATLMSTKITVSHAWSADPSAVAVGVNHTCAIDELGALYCWGANSLGELADLPMPTTAPTVLPLVTAPATMIATQVATGPNDTCAIGSDMNVYCWGQNQFGEVGTGAHFSDVPVPIALPQ